MFGWKTFITFSTVVFLQCRFSIVCLARLRTLVDGYLGSRFLVPTVKYYVNYLYLRGPVRFRTNRRTHQSGITRIFEALNFVRFDDFEYLKKGQKVIAISLKMPTKMFIFK